MRLLILAVGHKMPDWITAGFQEYTQRMPREVRIDLIEIKPEKRVSGKTVNQIRESEKVRILAALPKSCEMVALDEHGETPSTLELAETMKTWLRKGRDIALVIGGADGLHPDIKQQADRLLSLSRLTLPHGLARVVLAEQLYRVMMTLQNHPYHRQ